MNNDKTIKSYYVRKLAGTDSHTLLISIKEYEAFFELAVHESWTFGPTGTSTGKILLKINQLFPGMKSVENFIKNSELIKKIIFVFENPITEFNFHNLPLSEIEKREKIWKEILELNNKFI